MVDALTFHCSKCKKTILFVFISFLGSVVPIRTYESLEVINNQLQSTEYSKKIKI